MRLYRIKIRTKKDSYRLLTFQLTANNEDEAISESIKRLDKGHEFSKVESVDVFLKREIGGEWLPLLNLANNQ